MSCHGCVLFYTFLNNEFNCALCEVQNFEIFFDNQTLSDTFPELVLRDAVSLGQFSNKTWGLQERHVFILKSHDPLTSFN